MATVPTQDGATAHVPVAAAAPGPDPLALRLAAGVLIAVAAVGLAVIECFLVPLRIGSVPFPIAVPLAMAGNIVLARRAGRWTGSAAGAAVPPVLWLAVVIVLALPRAEGDLIVPGTLTGLVFLFAGAVSGAYGVASEITRRVKPVPAPRR
ncbi:MAG TPA: hypothetical protein VI357_09855 [Mycobacteriales bacterium]